MIVLDTHTLVWFAQADERLGGKSRDIIASATDGSLLISVILAWEISMLVNKSRIALGQDTNRWLQAVLADSTIRMVPVEMAIAIDAGSLPGSIHGDPADRIMIATARFSGIPLLTADRQILDYAREGHVRVLDARL